MLAHVKTAVSGHLKNSREKQVVSCWWAHINASSCLAAKESLRQYNSVITNGIPSSDALNKERNKAQFEDGINNSWPRRAS